MQTLDIVLDGATATCRDPEIVVDGYGPIICQMARKLIEAGVDPATSLDIRRGGTLCFDLLPVSKWAALTVWEQNSEATFVPFIPFSGIGQDAVRGHA